MYGDWTARGGKHPLRQKKKGRLASSFDTSQAQETQSCCKGQGQQRRKPQPCATGMNVTLAILVVAALPPCGYQYSLNRLDIRESLA
jgi:hypothetical protein